MNHPHQERLRSQLGTSATSPSISATETENSPEVVLNSTSDNTPVTDPTENTSDEDLDTATASGTMNRAEDQLDAALSDDDEDDLDDDEDFDDEDD